MSTARNANELKQRGAIEAAIDPNSHVTAEDAKRSIVEESRKAGVTAFTFDPNASSAEKLAQARAAIPEGFHNEKKTKGIAVITDVNNNAPIMPNLPPPSKVDVAAPAQLNEAASEDVEDPFSRTGWAPRFGWPADDVLAGESMLDHTTLLESALPDHLYGDWYHNTAVIVFACVASWLAAALGGGLGWLIIILAICATYYRTSLRRVRRNFRDDITRQLALKKLETDSESVEWMNAFMLKFWPIYQPVLAQTVILSVDQVLTASTPTFLDSLKLTTFTLGSKPPRMEHVRTLSADDDIVIMDWKFSFTPNDTTDMTAKQIKNKTNPKVVLEIRIGKAMISKGIDVILEDMAFSGLMRLKIKLQMPFPHIDRVDMCFLERPTIDYVCKPLGGDTFGFDINFIPGLETFILEQIHGTLGPMMYSPNVFPIEVAKMLAGTPVDQTIGVVAITLHGAHGLKISDSYGGTVDAYVVMTINRRQPPLAKTKVIKDNPNPRWGETHYIVVPSFADTLDMEVFDHNEFRKSRSLGTTSFVLRKLEEVNTHENERLEVIADGKARGVLSCDFRFFPVLDGKKMADGKIEPPPETNQGILRFTVEQAKDLDGSKSLGGLLNPYASLVLNGHVIHTTKRQKRTNNPVWDDGSKEILILDRKQATLGVAIKDERELTTDQIRGAKQVKLDDLLAHIQDGKNWYTLDGQSGGRVKMIAQWRPVAIGDITSHTGGYITPIGVMRFHFIRGMDLRNFETVGKSDSYARVLLSGIERACTVTFKNNLNPDWDEVLYVPVHTPKERLILDVMDAEKLNKDRSLGSTELYAGDFIQQHENGEYLVCEDKRVREDGLRLQGKGSSKGVLVYTVAFYPCLNIADPSEEDENPKAILEGDKETAARLEAEARAETHSNGDAVGANELGPAPRSPSSVNKPTQIIAAGANGDGAMVPISPLTASQPREDKENQPPLGPPVVHLTPQELLKYDSGLVLVRLLEAELPRANCQIEIYVDDMVFPSYVSSAPKSRTHKFDEIGDCFIRELEWSNLTLKVRDRGGDKPQENSKDNTLASLSGDTLSTLKQCLNNPTILKLKVKDDEGRACNVKVSLKYLPVKMTLDPSESIHNMGNLRVEILDAQNLPSADSNGLSDPFCKFELNGVEVFKTKVQKKTLNPSWNEYFEVPVPSRAQAKFRVEAWDWDLASNPDFLGGAVVRLDSLEPFVRLEVKAALDGESGTVRLRLLFTPSYIKRTRHGTSTFSGTFSSPAKLATLATSGPSKIGHGVGIGASLLKRPFRKRDDSNAAATAAAASAAAAPFATNGDLSPSTVPGLSLTNSDMTSGPVGSTAKTNGVELPLIDVQQASDMVDSSSGENMMAGSNGSAAGHSRTKSVGAASIYSTQGVGGSSSPAGTATFTVAQVSGYPATADVFVVISQVQPKVKQVGKTKDHKATGGTVRFDETFKIACSAEAQFQVAVRGRHKFSHDDDFGTVLYYVDDSGSGQTREIPVGPGTVSIRSSFAARPSSPTMANLKLSPSRGGEVNSPESGKSTMRRSLLSKREIRGSRESTPQS